MDRRDFLETTAALALGLRMGGLKPLVEGRARREFKISVAAWSLHREVFGGKIKLIDAFKFLREDYDVDGLELVNTMLEAPTVGYARRMRETASRYQMAIPLIMCDDEGALGDPDPEERKRAVRNHAKWVYLAADLGCHSIRVNWRGAPDGTEKRPAELRGFIDRSAPTFGELVELGRRNGINVIIENHGGPSSYAEALVGLIKAVNAPTFGTLPDFDNFPPDVDRYDAVDRMMPYAKAVSAKCYDFGPDGRETTIDFERMLQICVDRHGYHGFIGVEYEGDRLPERDGIRAGRDLLVKLRG